MTGQMFSLRTIPAALIVALTITVGGPRAARADDGLVSELKFDDPGELLADDSSGASNFADIRGAKWAKGPFGTALHFDGEDSYVSVPALNGLDGSDELTVEVWVLWEGTGQYPNIITGGSWSPGGFLIFVSERRCRFRMGRPDYSAHDGSGKWKERGARLVSDFELGKWYHLAATFDRPQITTYLNGEKVASTNWDYPVGYSGNVLIGRWGNTHNCHHGLIDGVKVYNRALSADEIATQYAEEAGGRAGKKGVQYEILPAKLQGGQAAVKTGTKTLGLQLDRRGRCIALLDGRTGDDHLAERKPFAIARLDGDRLRPTACTRDGDRIFFEFGGGKAKATIGIEERDRHVTFKVLSAEPQRLQRLTFVRLQPDLNKYRHRTSGLAAGDDLAICLRAVNLQTRATIGRRNGVMQAIATDDYGIVGARAAIVADSPQRIRRALQAMIEAEGAPQSDLGGPWAIDAPQTAGSYLFARVSEDNVEQWIDMALRGGFEYIHFNGWYRSRGHYEPRKSAFPNGLEGMREAVEKIHDAGLKAGMHTLTGCISTNDSWVTPVPDPRLDADATYTLAADMDAKSDAIRTVEKPQNHDTIWAYASRGNVIRIGDELIQYSAISRKAPYGFENCKRGAFGTEPASHDKGDDADHLRTIYRAFYPDENSTLVGEVADQIANVYNTCKMDQIYMDGSEGMGGWHAIAVMRNAIYERLKRPALIEASSWGHWSWYYHSRIGAWDHPKWGLKRFVDMHCDDIPQYRNGALLQAQLGWWAILGPTAYSPPEMPDEMEYFACKTFANDAPISIQGVRAAGRPSNWRTDEYLTTLGQYQRLRMANYFTDDVKKRVAEPRKEFQLRQADSGRWQFVRLDYSEHTIVVSDAKQRQTVAGDDEPPPNRNATEHSWAVDNQFGRQRPGFRVKALYAAEDYDSGGAMTMAAPQPDQFTVHRTARGVTLQVQRSTEFVKSGDASLKLSATNNADTSRGAWAMAGRRFQPDLNMQNCRAIGLWVHGDGKGELLNVQLQNPREYNRAYAENYIHIDFEGWRYCALLLRERDADEYHDYKWPYFSQHGIFRNRLRRGHVNKLNLYLNGLPAGEKATVYISEIRAVPTTTITFSDPIIAIGGEWIAIPVQLNSGRYVELAPTGEWRKYDRRCRLLERGKLEGELPEIDSGPQQLGLTFGGNRNGDGPAVRAKVTTITRGEPFGERRPADDINSSALRYEYVEPQLITAIDGEQNEMQVMCRPDADDVELQFELRVEGTGGQREVYSDPDALTIESFDDLSFFEQSEDNEYTKYVHDGDYRGIANKPGVTHEIERSKKIAKVGGSSLCYTATSTSERKDNGGWSARGRRFAEYLDLSDYSAIGFWLHGDGNGEAFKLQLRDDDGGWYDMVTRVSFSGWRYCEFSLDGANRLDLSRIEYLIMYYNGLPGGKTVTCRVDDLRALPAPPPIINPQLTVNGRRITFPVELSAGDRLVYKGISDCTVHRGSGEPAAPVKPEGRPPLLQTGENTVVLSMDPTSPDQFRAVFMPLKLYR